MRLQKKNISAPNGTIGDHQMEHRLFFHAVSFCLPVCLVCCAKKKKNRSISSLLPTNFLEDSTEPEEQKSLLILYGLQFRQVRWFLICMVLTCRHFKTSFHKHESIWQGIICMNNTWFLTWQQELSQTFHSH